MLLPRLVLIAGFLTLGACSGFGGLGRAPPTATPVPSNEALQAAQLAAMATSQQQLVQGSPAEQAEVLAAAKAAYEASRQGPPLLRYALVLATPGHPGRDLDQAQRLLREALARPELLSPTERAIAVVEQQRLDGELRLKAENTRLLAEAQRERDRQRNTTSSATIARRLQAEQEENARLRKALEEAQAKLDAIANIERSISDRPPANEGRNP
jgi:hypothetical protein